METRLLRTRAPGVPIEIGILEKQSSALDLRLPPMLLVHGATSGRGCSTCRGLAIR